MYCDVLSNLIGNFITVFISKGNQQNGLNGSLLEVGQDYIVLSGKQEGEKNYIHMDAIINIVAITE